jgi:hypothetical protein
MITAIIPRSREMNWAMGPLLATKKQVYFPIFTAYCLMIDDIVRRAAFFIGVLNHLNMKIL